MNKNARGLGSFNAQRYVLYRQLCWSFHSNKIFIQACITPNKKEKKDVCVCVIFVYVGFISKFGIWDGIYISLKNYLMKHRCIVPCPECWGFSQPCRIHTTQYPALACVWSKNAYFSFSNPQSCPRNVAKEWTLLWGTTYLKDPSFRDCYSSHYRHGAAHGKC